jgi:hypothetical protein
MKTSLEALKKKVSDVLRLFKAELENKFARKIKEANVPESIVRSSRGDVSEMMSKQGE